MREQLNVGGNGIKDFFEWMGADITRTFDDAINNFSSQLGSTNNANYISSVKSALGSLDLTSGSRTLSVGTGTLSIDLSNAATGAIGGAPSTTEEFVSDPTSGRSILLSRLSRSI